jgi:hypothetical protein
MPITQTFFAHEIRDKLIDYSTEVERFSNADEVLDRLHDIVSEKNHLRIPGASRFCVKSGDWRQIELGKTVFFHNNVPQGWIDEWTAFVVRGHALALMTARMCLAPFTWTELSRYSKCSLTWRS